MEAQTKASVAQADAELERELKRRKIEEDIKDQAVRRQKLEEDIKDQAAAREDRVAQRAQMSLMLQLLQRFADGLPPGSRSNSTP